jgi:hypothetical protein
MVYSNENWQIYMLTCSDYLSIIFVEICPKMAMRHKHLNVLVDELHC